MLEKIDLEKKMDREEYRKASEAMGVRLGAVQRELKEKKIPVIIVFEGLGAAGKGIQINRLIAPLDPRGLEVYASRQTGEEEQMRPFLWRFWTKTPEQGRIAIFDRSWYRKVTEERFEEKPGHQENTRACVDILSFEEQLCVGGGVGIERW